MALINNIKNAIENNTKAIRYLKVILLMGVCLFGFAYSLLYAETWYKFDEGYTHDEGNYIAMAKRLLEGGSYGYWGSTPDAYVTPGFPIFLVICMSIFGTDLYALHAIKIVQCVLVGLTVLLVYLLGYMLTKRYSVGIIGAILTALNGMMHFYARFLLTETLFTFTMLLFMVVAVYAWRKDKWWLYLISGVLLCASTMVRASIVVVLPVIFVIDIIKKRKNWKAFVYSLGFFLLGFILLGLPWWIRNVVTLDKFIFLATQTNPIYAGLAPDVEALGLTDPGSLFGNIKLLFELLIKQPAKTVYWMTVGKFTRIFMSNSGYPYFNLLTGVVCDFTVLVGLCGCVRALFSKKLFCYIAVFFVFFLSIFMFIPVNRYSLAYMPLLAIGAGYLLTKAFEPKKVLQNGENL